MKAGILRFFPPSGVDVGSGMPVPSRLLSLTTKATYAAPEGFVICRRSRDCNHEVRRDSKAQHAIWSTIDRGHPCGQMA